MGLAALKELGSQGYANVTAEVKVGSTPPGSCLVDSILSRLQ
jgi:hypothetical protein